MKLSFLGADHEVTGSCHYLQACGKKILVDCGMQQGPDEYEHQEMPVAPGEIDYVLLTHAHIDHSGRIPLLAKYGFRGSVCTTEATSDLCSIMLRDSAHIQEFEAEWKNRKGKRAGRDPVEPLYTMEDAEKAISLFSPYAYGERIHLCDGLSIRFTDCGHLLGSAAIEVWATENGVTKKIAFSGDIGNVNQPLINDPQYLSEADYIVMESTYGTRLHQPPPDYCSALAEIIQRTFDRGGNVVIPSFAVGRTQELLYFLREIKERELVKYHSNFPVYVDSPLAIEATQIFRNNQDDYDYEAMELLRRGVNPLSFPNLITAVTSDESRAINFDQNPKVIISASGMCEAGRIKHHLKHNLWRPECTIVFVGYQAHGTTGRLISEGEPSVKLFGESIDVEAEIVKLEGLSGHADQAGLLRWLDAFTYPPERIFVVHGEESVCDAFAQIVADKYHVPVSAPDFGEEYDLLENRKLKDGIKRQIAKERSALAMPSGVFGRLAAAGKRLLLVIEHNKGGTNKDLAKFADQITALCDKWDR